MPPKKQRDEIYKPYKNWRDYNQDNEENASYGKSKSKIKSEYKEGRRQNQKHYCYPRKNVIQNIVRKESKEQEQLLKRSSAISTNQISIKRPQNISMSLQRSSSQDIPISNPSISHQGLNLEEKWNRKSQISTKSRIIKQYERYFANDQNVFYEHTPLMRWDSYISFLLPKILKALITLGIILFIVRSVKPYDKPCPRHASCGAYIHCHEGYLLNQKLQICEVDPEITKTAHVIVDSIITDMQLEYGDKQCELIKKSIYKDFVDAQPPKKSLYEIYRELDIESQVLKTQLSALFDDQNLQKIRGFDKDHLGYIYPTQKKYSLHATIDWHLEKHPKTVYFIVALMVVAIVKLLIVGYKKAQQRKAFKIYNFLKQRSKQQKQIDIQKQKLQIEQKYNGGKPIHGEMWVQINNYRIKQKLIGAYEDDSVKWRLL